MSERLLEVNIVKVQRAGEERRKKEMKKKMTQQER
jgi:hypothetical protein